jgi:hypothetical protein
MRGEKEIWKWLRYSAVMGILLIGFQNCGNEHQLGADLSSTGTGGVDPAVFARAQADALEVLQNRCASCHNGTVSGTTPDVMDVAGLRASMYIIPGYPQNSPLYLVMVDGRMPQGGPNLAGTVEILKIRDWIQMMR